MQLKLVICLKLIETRVANFAIDAHQLSKESYNSPYFILKTKKKTYKNIASLF